MYGEAVLYSRPQIKRTQKATNHQVANTNIISIYYKYEQTENSMENSTLDKQLIGYGSYKLRKFWYESTKEKITRVFTVTSISEFTKWQYPTTFAVL